MEGVLPDEIIEEWEQLRRAYPDDERVRALADAIRNRTSPLHAT